MNIAKVPFNLVLVPFNLVFGGSTAPRALLDRGCADVPEVRLLLRNATSGVDSLDDCTAVSLKLAMDIGRRRRLSLWRHKHNPPAQAAIQISLDEEFQDALA